MPAVDRLTGSVGPVSVLVVDDNPDHRALIRMRLTAAGVHVTEAGSGEEALRLLDGVQLVLCDYQLPGMNGLETLRAIRARSDSSVIMVTGAGSESLVVDVLRAGAADYLVKDPTFLSALPGVIERSWRHHDLAVRAAELERLSLLVSSAKGRDEMLGGIVSGARRLLRADTCLLYLERGDEMVEQARDGEPVKEPGLLLAKARAALDVDHEVVVELTPTRHLVIPLRFENLVFGALAVVTRAPRGYMPEELRLARSFAAFAGIALSNLHRLELQTELVERLQGLNDLRRDLVASVSHELRTPLTCIVGFASTLDQRWDNLSDQQRRSFVTQIQDHGAELTEQVDRLLDVAALEAGRVSAAPKPVDLADEIPAVMDLLEPLLEGRPVTVDVPSLRVIADPTLLRRALNNLVSNAARVALATAALEGAGVGLALVKESMRVMGGDVTATFRPGVGSVFSLTLPLDVPAPS